ncbi:diguanylate cyclase [Photobacterium gaetbulicola]|uniref:diguanylate cyclase n=1 Tax=Photobacterium gaetbulicola TaxID=1295392 RepID=A0A0B9H2K1_9GAMM|nr:diguanylate cyclase [Photobacterium gaetbulicola]KHT63057.1 diguanylate cyclase [Photobacterium gaetbulicola]
MTYPDSLSEFHLAAQVIDNIDAGVVMLDSEHRVMIWNTFMQAYSGISVEQIMGQNLFEAIPDLPEEWLRNKIQSTFKLGTRSFSSWEDRPFIFNFTNFSPVTGGMTSMFQNMTLTPLKALDGEYRHICLTVTDVSDIAKSKIHLRESNAQLTHLSITDKLTQLYNRGHWESCLSTEFDQCRHYQTVSSLVMFDIDHFKKVNDTFGHIAGDAVIKSISSLLKKAKRQSDIAGRYGGEEFGVILPGTSSELAQYFTDRLRKRVEESLVKMDIRDIRVTISLGLCEWAPWMSSYEQWLECADSALYQSKRAGRNQCTVYQSAAKQCADMSGVS